MSALRYLPGLRDVGPHQQPDVRRGARLQVTGRVGDLPAPRSGFGIRCAGSGSGSPGAAVATGDAESQRAADRVVRDYADDLGYALPPPGSTPSARIDARVPAVLDAWRATVTRELVSASGPSSDRRLLMRLTVDWGPRPPPTGEGSRDPPRSLVAAR